MQPRGTVTKESMAVAYRISAPAPAEFRRFS